MGAQAGGDSKNPEVRAVEEWHSALNAANIERLLELSHTQVEVGGPRGRKSGNAKRLLGDWVKRANILLTVRRLFHIRGTVVAEEEARWRDADTGEMGGAQIVGTIFTVRNGRVASILRHPGLEEALAAADLDVSYEVTKSL